MSEQVAAAGGQIAVVSLGTPASQSSGEFCGERAPGVLCLSNPQAELYELYGVGRAGAGQLMNVQVLTEGIKAALAGHRAAVTQQDMRRMPATFVIGCDSILTLAYYSRHVADYPPGERLLETLGQAMTARNDEGQRIKDESSEGAGGAA